MKERSRVKKTLKFILCIALLLLQNDFNVLAEVNETETEIVDENSYQKINLNEIDKMKNAAMGQNQEMTSRDFRDVGPYWVNENGIKSFYDANNVLFERKGTKKIIDVSEHNGKIDWKKVKSSDVDGVIIRVGYGHLMEDKYFNTMLVSAIVWEFLMVFIFIVKHMMRILLMKKQMELMRC